MIGGGVGRGVLDFSRSFPFLDLRVALSVRSSRVGSALFLREDPLIDCRGTLGREGGRDTGCEGAVVLALNEDNAGGVTGSSATRWEPGSARAPTFCAEPGPPGKASGDGDLPPDGDGGGDPKRESSSSCSGSWVCDIALFSATDVG